MNKPKSRRSTRKKGYYTQQFARTEANKARRATKRKTRAEKWAKIHAAEKAEHARLAS